jgi:TorA maturation chaperone TorD
MVLEEWLAERQAFASLLAGLYRGDVATGIEGLRDRVPVGETDADDDDSVRRSLRRLFAGWEAEGRENIMQDYAALFGGPGQLRAPPWESVYRTKEKLLFGEPEAAVRHFYRSFGLSSVATTEPADHVALELAFLGRLSGLAMDDPERLVPILAGQRAFVAEHLLSWLPAWSIDVSRHARCGFWKTLTALTLVWLSNDLAEVEAVLAHTSSPTEAQA